MKLYILLVYCFFFQLFGIIYLNKYCSIFLIQTRKYLDAWCVFFWATTPTLFSFSTFGLFTLTGHDLDAATVCDFVFNVVMCAITKSYLQIIPDP